MPLESGGVTCSESILDPKLDEHRIRRSPQGGPLAALGAGPALCGPQLQWCHRRLRATAAQLQRGEELRLVMLVHSFLISFLFAASTFAGYRFVQDLERQVQSAISLSQPGRSWQLGFGMFVMCCSKYTS